MTPMVQDVRNVFSGGKPASALTAAFALSGVEEAAALQLARGASHGVGGKGCGAAERRQEFGNSLVSRRTACPTPVTC